jgi:drug/metabolite transporter (DMT)-like permease
MNFFKTYKGNLFLNLILVYIIWGSTYMGVKIALTDLTPLLLTSMRFLVGGLVLFVISYFYQGLPSLQEAKGSALLGILLSGFATSTLAYTIQFLPTGLVALLAALLPVWVFLLDFFFFSKNKPSYMSGGGMLIGLCGVLFLFNPFGVAGSVDSSQLIPIFLVFLSSFVWAFASLLSLKTTQAKGITGVSIQMVSGGLVALTASLVFESSQLETIMHMSQTSVLAMLYLILIGSYIGYTGFIWLINNAPPILSSTYAFVNPVVAIIIGYYIADEVLNSSSIVASCLIITGVVFMTIGRRKKGDF